MTKLGLVVVALFAGCVDPFAVDEDPSPPPSMIGSPDVHTNGTVESGLTPFAMEGGELFDMASDATHLYWIHVGGQPSHPVGVVKRMPLAGGPTEILTTVRSFVYALAVSEGFVYFTATPGAYGDYAGQVYKLPVTGGTPTVLATGFNPLEINVEGNWVYFTEGKSPDGRISRVRTSGGAPELVVCDVDAPADLVAKGGTLYYSEMNRGRMMRVVPGSSPVVLADGWVSTSWMTIDDSFVYFIGTGKVFDHVEPDLYRVPRGGGASEFVATTTQKTGKLAIAGEHLVWGSIVMSPEGAQPTSLNTDPEMLFDAVQVRSDAVFFADYYTGAMFRSPL